MRPSMRIVERLTILIEDLINDSDDFYDNCHENRLVEIRLNPDFFDTPEIFRAKNTAYAGFLDE